MHIRHVVVAALALSSFAFAQSSYTASVRGVVTDRSGAAVVGAKVNVNETERNVPTPSSPTTRAATPSLRYRRELTH